MWRDAKVVRDRASTSSSYIETRTCFSRDLVVTHERQVVPPCLCVDFPDDGLRRVASCSGV